MPFVDNKLLIIENTSLLPRKLGKTLRRTSLFRIFTVLLINIRKDEEVTT